MQQLPSGNASTLEKTPHEISLQNLLKELGEDFAEPLFIPKRTLLVHDAEFYDGALGIMPGQNTLLYLVNFESIPFSQLEQIYSVAKINEYSGIAAKINTQNLTIAADLAKRFDLGLIRVRDSVPWQRFDSLLTNVIGIFGALSSIQPVAIPADIYSIANTVADAFQGAVTIEDLARELLGYSTRTAFKTDTIHQQEILARKSLLDVEQPELYRLIMQSTTPVFSPGSGNRLPRIGMSISGGSLPLGSMWVVVPEFTSIADMTPAQLQILTESCKLAANYILRQRNADIRGSVARNATLSQCLKQQVVNEQQEIQLTGGSIEPGVLLSFSYFRTKEFEHSAASVMQQLYWRTSRFFHSLLPNSSFALSDHFCFVYLPATHWERGLALARQFLQHMPQDQKFHGAVSQSGRPTAMFAQQHTEVLELLDYNEWANPHPTHTDASVGPIISTVHDVGPALLMSRASQVVQQAPHLLSGALRELLDKDSKLHHSFAHTLLAYYDSGCDIVTTAAKLNVHQNTVRYRLKRITEEHDLDIHDADIHLILWLQLRSMLRERSDTSLSSRRPTSTPPM